ncbi:MAG: hypothetical protein JSC085_000366 [Candidatus Tokpelaia sp. JSC085]|nr:MAG: hypothetical protein JSC085_000366 [Candidatus Tokpelaia sp. JSC085]
MLRTVSLTATVLLIAITSGLWSIHHVLTTFCGFDKMRIGQWEAFPNAGTENADPYFLAYTVWQGHVALGRAEGLSLYLWKDDEDKPLTGQCRYRFKGLVPETRFFTLYAVDKHFIPVNMNRLLPSALYSHEIIRYENTEMTILISSTAEPGNWLAVKTRKEYGLVLTLYDTQIVTTSGLTQRIMPSVERIKEGHCV